MKKIPCSYRGCGQTRSHFTSQDDFRLHQMVEVPDDFEGDCFCSLTCMMLDGKISVKTENKEVENRDRHLRQIEGEFMDKLRFMWKEYVLCDENELTEDAKALRAELLDCIKESK